MQQAGSYRLAIAVFGASSLIAVLLGAAVMAQGEIPLSGWVRNPLAWLAAMIVCTLIAWRRWFGTAAIVIAVILVGATLVGPGQDGVFRWVGAGPVQLNAAALVLPPAIAAFTFSHRWIAALCFILMGAVIARQPDISQLAGLVIASVILFGSSWGWKGGLGAPAVGGLLAAYCLSRPDPLQPVPDVEGIVQLAVAQSILLGGAMVAALVAAVVSPLTLWRTPEVRWQALALSAYFGATALAPMVGAYPVPLAGYGLSFVIGWWLGIAGLWARRPG